MKQLLLLLTIHSLIFHQQEKDKKEKLFVTLEKSTVVNAKPQKDWNFLLDVRATAYDSLYFSRIPSPRPVIYTFGDYSYIAAKARE